MIVKTEPTGKIRHFDTLMLHTASNQRHIRSNSWSQCVINCSWQNELSLTETAQQINRWGDKVDISGFSDVDNLWNKAIYPHTTRAWFAPSAQVQARSLPLALGTLLQSNPRTSPWIRLSHCALSACRILPSQDGPGPSCGEERG